MLAPLTPGSIFAERYRIVRAVASGGFGTVYAGNITPDLDTGIGRWTEEQFIQTMRTGKWMGIGRAILPPMPWPAFAALSDDDLRAIYAYLRTIPALSNRVPDPAVPPPVLTAFEETYAKLRKM